VEFHVLGPLEVTSGGRPLSVGGTRTRAVLAFLLINANAVVPAGRLADELWPGLEPSRAAANLQVRLSELRKALRSAGEEDRLATRAPGYVLQVTPGQLDVLQFQQLASSGREALAAGDAATAVRLLDQALALWRGPALADLGDLQFAAAEQARLEEERLGVLESRVDAQLMCGRHREPVAELEALTTRHPLRERFWSQRLLALYRAGRQADALRAYRELRSTLVDQLGIEPGPELRDLQARILSQDSALEYQPARPADARAQPETRYAQNGEIHIAYQVLGRGERDIVFVPGALSHLDLLWEDPETAGFFQRLATLGRLILFDKRDTGLSDRAPAYSPLEERMDDVRAVMHAAGSAEAVLFGYSEGAPMSILFAATYPDRVSSLILGAATARYRRAPDYPCGRGSDEMLDSLEKIAAQRWGQGATIDWFLPSRASSPQARQMFARFERMAVSPSAFLRIIRMVREIDVRAVLPAIHVPTLVIQRLDDIMTPPCHGRYLASHIASARYFEQPGDHSLRFAGSGDIDRLFDEVEDFLTGTSHRRDPERVLATILLAEAADSEESADSSAHPDQASDRPQAGHLDAYGAVISQRVRSHRGRLRESSAQSILATFDAPGQAIRAAAAIRDAASAHGIQLRTGIHTGEVDLAGDEIGGISVDIARRVTAQAQPAEILVSRTVKDLVAGSGISFAGRGPHELTGTADRWPLFAVTGLGR
jgi:DNA-binding SARP family transcriptional activator/pimeloyl-ACP methyl ester carboxylesterase/class 3 adenylate cyclase